tara:strand:+ start:92 stop:1567 length:1476 start_codon:yes stop_codon:yes gene_type:complete
MPHWWFHRPETVTTVIPAPAGDSDATPKSSPISLAMSSAEEASLAKIAALPPKELMEHNFIEYLKKYPKDYGESSTDLFADPRTEGFLKIAQSVVEHNLTPNALPDGQTEAVVLAIGPGTAQPYSSRDTTVKAQSTNTNNLYKSFTLTCYDLKAPTTCFVTPKEAATLDPKALILLPEFRGTWQSGMTMPTLGDVVKVQYDRKSYRSGEFISVVPNQNIAHMIQTTDPEEENIAYKFAKQRYDTMNLEDFKKLSKEEILECAQEYDKNKKDIKGPRRTSTGELEVTNWWSNQRSKFMGMDHRMIPYVKCFIWRCWEKEKVLIRINSTYRDLGQQRSLRIAWLLKTPGQLQPAASYAPQSEQMYPMGTDPTTVPAGSLISMRSETEIAGPSRGSMHNAALAFDFNPTFPDGSGLGGKSPRNEWFSKGAKIVRIGKQMGLKWGGEFGGCATAVVCKGWDPIHFDMRDILGSAKQSAMAKLHSGDESGLGERAT